jgi:hypothetical protein
MVQRGRGFRLNFKTLAFPGVGCNVVRKKLDRHDTFEPRILGFVDHTHAAFAELFDDL